MSSISATRRARGGALLASATLAAALLAAVFAGPVDASLDPSGQTTVDQRVVGNPEAVFSKLRFAPGDPYFVRRRLADPQPGRESRRSSIAYFGQISDMQLADEESPARVELFDTEPTRRASSSGFRPQEALVPHLVESTIRQMNLFAESPIADGDGGHAQMLNVMLTGDLADNSQRNEVTWLRGLLEGGEVVPGSGLAGAAGLGCALLPPDDRPLGYTGVQDYDDYYESPLFYDPERPLGPYDGWPSYPGLMDRAQRRFAAAGLDAPSYVVLGNHDVLVQGNEDANAGYEAAATGCLKPIGPVPDGTRPEDVLDPAHLTGLATTRPDRLIGVPADPRRQFVDRRQYRQLMAAGGVADAHGLALVDQGQRRASDGSASYYSFEPRPGLRFVVLDSNGSGAGFLVDPLSPSVSSEGNIDDPQFRWLGNELDDAQADGDLVMVFAHHAIGSLTWSLSDEAATPCTFDDAHGHDVNPGCDADPRSSTPIHRGDDVEALLGAHPNVIAYVAGHSHDNEVRPFDAPGAGGFWQIKSPAIADWPAQSRLIELMDNHDGTLSVFATLLNAEAPLDVPAAGTPATGLGVRELASLGRAIAYNDPQEGPDGSDGEPRDRNVELVIRDPR